MTPRTKKGKKHRKFKAFNIKLLETTFSLVLLLPLCVYTSYRHQFTPNAVAAAVQPQHKPPS